MGEGWWHVTESVISVMAEIASFFAWFYSVNKFGQILESEMAASCYPVFMDNFPIITTCASPVHSVDKSIPLFLVLPKEMGDTG